MNVRLQYDFDFLAGIYYDDCLQLNSYTVSINLLTKTKDTVSTNIAMERIKVFVFDTLKNTVFINQENMEHAEILQLAGVNVTTLPEEPVDQIVGMMLYYKLNAIMEGRMEIVNIDVSSTLGDGIWYQHDEEDSSGPFVATGWWHDATIQHHSIDPEEEEPDNVLKVVSTGWYEYELEWPENVIQTNANVVVFANFSKNED